MRGVLTSNCHISCVGVARVSPRSADSSGSAAGCGVSGACRPVFSHTRASGKLARHSQTPIQDAPASLPRAHSALCVAVSGRSQPLDLEAQTSGGARCRTGAGCWALGAFAGGAEQPSEATPGPSHPGHRHGAGRQVLPSQICSALGTLLPPRGEPEAASGRACGPGRARLPRPRPLCLLSGVLLTCAPAP